MASRKAVQGGLMPDSTEDSLAGKELKRAVLLQERPLGLRLHDRLLDLWPWLADASLSKPIFVVGHQRSGTSVLLNLLVQNPHLQNFVRYADPKGGDENEPFWERWGMPPRRPTTGKRLLASEEATPAVIEGMRAELRQVAHRGRRLITKGPVHGFRLLWLKRIFPDLYVVHIIRDGRAVIESMLRRDQIKGYYAYWSEETHSWGRYDPLENADLLGHPNALRPGQVDDRAIRLHMCSWVTYVEMVRRQAASLSHYLEVRYEDMCADTRSMVGRVYDFCGVGRHWLARWTPPDLPDQNHKWRTFFTAEQQAFIAREFGDVLAGLGYE
jgi:hypothetical protein